MKNYRPAFLLALAVIVVLLGAVAGLWWYSRAAMSALKTESQAAGASMAASASGPPSATPEQAETPLVPMQISAQRLQSIGVKTGEVQRKFVHDEILTTGNVAVDETRLAYVQVRFSGYIQRYSRMTHTSTSARVSLCSRFTVPTSWPRNASTWWQSRVSSRWRKARFRA